GFALIARAWGAAASTTSVANRSTPARSREKPSGSVAGSGSRPRHRTVPVAAERAARPPREGPGRGPAASTRAREVGAGPWAGALELADGLGVATGVGAGVGTGSSLAGMTQSGRDVPSRPDTSVRGLVSVNVQTG